jgi:selenide,water dikinase
MLPGFLAGHYTRNALDIDLETLADAVGAELILGHATAIDPVTKRIEIENHTPLGYDLLSIDIGINTILPDLPGFHEHAIPAKPLTPFAQAWDDYRHKTGPAKIAIIGGGIAGCEVALAFAQNMRARKRPAQITVIEKHRAFTPVSTRAAKRLRQALNDYGITLLEQAVITGISRNQVHLNDQTVAAEFICGAAGGQPHELITRCGLTLQQGDIAVNPYLQTSHEDVFAVGDCAYMSHAPRPKAGVYAVRQAPILAHNLQVRLTGQGDMRPYQPQDDYLKLISLGEKSALADKFGYVWAGRAMWLWKDHIDRKFMAQFHDLRADA